MPRVLLVDDQPDLLYLAERQLHRLHATTVGFLNALEALDFLDTDHNVDVIFTDYAMPRMNGLEFIDRLKEQHPSIPVVMVTASASPEILEKAVEKGAVYIIQNFFEHEHFANALRAVQVTA